MTLIERIDADIFWFYQRGATLRLCALARMSLLIQAVVLAKAQRRKGRKGKILAMVGLSSQRPLVCPVPNPRHGQTKVCPTLPLAVLIQRAFPYTQSQTALSFKRFPDSFNVPSRAEFQHQFDPRLMARKHSAQDRAHLTQLAARALVSVSVEHAPARASRRDDYRKAGLDGALDRGQGGDRDIAATEAFNH